VRILLIDEQRALTRPLLQRLTMAGFLVEVVADVAEGDFRAQTCDYDLILFALVTPREKSFARLREWRQRGLTTPVLMLLGHRHRVTDRVRCLEVGADDYLARPFHAAELLARVRALIRRGPAERAPVLRIHDLEIDTAARAVKRGGQTIPLTSREFSLLRLLAVHRGRIVSRDTILEHMQDAGGTCSSNGLNVYIRYLRAKIDEGFGLPLILTRYGRGYLIRGEGA
jgi:DNA-binding response OmpR family regulator